MFYVYVLHYHSITHYVELQVLLGSACVSLSLNTSIHLGTTQYGRW